MMRVVRSLVWAAALAGLVPAGAQTVQITDLAMSKGEDGFVVTGKVTGSDLNPEGQVVESDLVSIIADLKQNPLAVYPFLPDALLAQPPAGAETGYLRGGRPLIRSQHTGRYVDTIVLARVTLREAPVWQAYGGPGEWRTRAPASVTAEFAGGIPLQFERRQVRVRALLEHVWRGPEAPAANTSYHHHVAFEGQLTEAALASAAQPPAPVAPGEAEAVPSLPLDLLLRQSDAPAGWSVAIPCVVPVSEVSRTLLPVTVLQQYDVQAAAVQEVRTPAHTLMAGVVVLPRAEEAQALVADLRALPGSTAQAEVVEVAGPVPVSLVTHGALVLLAAGETESARQILQLMAGSPAGTVVPPIVLPPAPSEPVEPGPEETAPADFLARAVLCRGLDERNEPVGVATQFEAGIKRVGAYLRFADAPPGTSVVVKWYRGQSLMVENPFTGRGNQIFVSYIDLSGQSSGLRADEYRVEVWHGDDMIRALPFTVVEQ